MLIKKEVDIAKEADEVMEAVVSIVKDLKAGKTIQEVGAGNLPKILAAVQGIDQLDDEMAQNKGVVLATIGYRSGELAGALLEKKA